MADRMQLAFVKIAVADIPQTEAFYAAVFGMTRRGDFATPNLEEVFLRGEGGMSLVAVRWKDGRIVKTGSRLGPIGFYVEEVDAAFERAIGAGATSVLAPVSGPDGMRVAIFSDLDGLDVELISGFDLLKP